ncbi:MAG: hypothetical protein ACRDRN_24075, partial [Sciscionella sp.]
QAEHDRLNKPEYQHFRNGFHASSLPSVRYRTLTAHIAEPESCYSQRYQRSIDCQQPQQRRRAETTAAYPENVREWSKVEQPLRQS